MKNVIVLTGANSFLMHREIDFWVTEFIKKHGAENITILDATSMTHRALLDAVSTPSLFAAKRLVVCRGLPSCTAEEAKLLIATVHEDTVLIIVLPTIDKRLTSVKYILSVADVRTFEPLAPVQLRSWLIAYAAEHQIAVSQPAIVALTTACLNDQYACATELDRLAFLHRPIEALTIDAITMPVGDVENWYVSNALATGDMSATLRTMEELYERGVSYDQQWASVCKFLAETALVLAAQMDRTSPASAQRCGLHPFAFAAMAKFLRAFDRQSVERCIDAAASYELALKTGSLRSGESGLDEIICVILLTIATLRPVHASSTDRSRDTAPVVMHRTAVH